MPKNSPDIDLNQSERDAIIALLKCGGIGLIWLLAGPALGDDNTNSVDESRKKCTGCKT